MVAGYSEDVWGSELLRSACGVVVFARRTAREAEARGFARLAGLDPRWGEGCDRALGKSVCSAGGAR